MLSAAKAISVMSVLRNIDFPPRDICTTTALQTLPLAEKYQVKLTRSHYK